MPMHGTLVEHVATSTSMGYNHFSGIVSSLCDLLGRLQPFLILIHRMTIGRHKEPMICIGCER